MDDVDMDAPQISTLREEATPPRSRGSKFRVKLLVSDKKGSGKSSSPSVPAAMRKSAPQNQTLPQAQSEEDVDEEEEEDQLIDEDEPAPSVSAPIASVSAGTKRKAPPKKPSRPRKSDKQDKEDKKPDGESSLQFLYVPGQTTIANRTSRTARQRGWSECQRGCFARETATQEKGTSPKNRSIVQAQNQSTAKVCCCSTFQNSCLIITTRRGPKALANPPVEDTAMSESEQKMSRLPDTSSKYF